jgi:hypothetical protein
MTRDELTEKISKLKGIEPAPTMPGTFVDHNVWQGKETFHFLRAVADDIVLKASTQNLNASDAAVHAQKILDFAVSKLAQVRENLVTRIERYHSGNETFDTFLSLGPSITKTVIADGYFLQTRTTQCYAINHIEFAGNETEAEAVVRKKHVRLTDVTRAITPVIFGRYQKQTGQKSASYLAIATHESTVRDIKQMPRDGGIVEFENWERERMTLTTDQGNPNLELRFNGQNKTVSVNEALKLMDELVFKGAAAAQKLM